MEFIADFLHDYDVDVTCELPSGGSSERTLYYPGATESGGRDGVLIRVTPKGGRAWVGMFAPGYYPLNAVYSCPDPKSLCVISGGTGYLINSAEPKQWSEIPCFPVLDVRTIYHQGLILFVQFAEIVAYNSAGKLWKTSGLAHDGITIIRIDDTTIYGTATCVSTDDQDFTVNAKTGSHTGGCPRIAWKKLSGSS